MASLEPRSVEFEAVWREEVLNPLLELFLPPEQQKPISASAVY